MMDLEFMILDTFDQIRPSYSFKKFESLSEATLATEKLHQFESKHFKTGSIDNQIGTKNLMSVRNIHRYDDLIDSLAYFDDDLEDEKDKQNKKRKKEKTK